MTAPTPAGQTPADRGPETTADLTREHFGWWIEIPTRQVAGYLYVIRDEFHDGYPSRYLVLVDDDGGAVEEEFSDSHPRGYPKTLRTPIIVRPGAQPVAGQLDALDQLRTEVSASTVATEAHHRRAAAVEVLRGETR